MFKEMTSSRPYLLRSLNEWILENNMTPHIVVDAAKKDVIVPMEFVSSGKIVLNLSPGAVHGLTIDNDFICFSARFSGKAMDVIVPINAIMAIYAKENGQGMVFTDEVSSASQVSEVKTSKESFSKTGASSDKEKTYERPSLTLVQ